MNNKQNKKNNSGFTLLESVIAVSLLVSAVVGPMTLAQQAIRAQEIAQDNLLAANFAQEGIELIRNYRSNNVLRSTSADPLDDWLLGMNDCQTSVGCAIDAVVYVEAPALPECDDAPETCLLFFHNPSGVYYHCDPVTCERTKFSRALYIEEIADQEPEEAKVTSVVSWVDRLGNNRTFILSSRMFNW